MTDGRTDGRTDAWTDILATLFVHSKADGPDGQTDGHISLIYNYVRPSSTDPLLPADIAHTPMTSVFTYISDTFI